MLDEKNFATKALSYFVMLLFCILCLVFALTCIVFDSWAWSLIYTFSRQHNDRDKAYALALFLYFPTRALILTTTAAVASWLRSPHTGHVSQAQVAIQRGRISLMLQIFSELISTLYSFMLAFRLGLWLMQFNRAGDQKNSIYCVACGIIVMTDILGQCCVIIGHISSLAGHRPYFMEVLDLTLRSLVDGSEAATALLYQ